MATKLVPAQSESFNASPYLVAFNTALGVLAQSEESKAVRKKAERNTARILENFEVYKGQVAEESAMIDEQVGDALSDIGKESLRAASTLVAMSAASGTAGGTTAAISQEAVMDGLDAMDKVLSQGKASKAQLAREELNTRLRVRQEIQAEMDDLETDPTRAVLKSILGSFSTGMDTLGSLDAESQAQFFDIG